MEGRGVVDVDGAAAQRAATDPMEDKTEAGLPDGETANESTNR